MINYNAQLDHLFDLWEKRCPEYTFVRDGIMRNIPNENEAWFLTKRRIAFLLKDKSDGSCDDVRDWLIDNENPNNQKNRRLGCKLFRNISNVLYGLLNDDYNYSHVENNPQVNECLLNMPFAYIECKKEAGKGSLKDSELKCYLNRDADFLHIELSILRPNIYICSGWPISEFVKDMFPQSDLFIHSNNLAYDTRTRTLILLGYHPTARTISPNVYFAGVMNHYMDFLKTSYGEDFLLSLK